MGGERWMMMDWKWFKSDASACWFVSELPRDRECDPLHVVRQDCLEPIQMPMQLLSGARIFPIDLLVLVLPEGDHRDRELYRAQAPYPAPHQIDLQAASQAGSQNQSRVRMIPLRSRPPCCDA